MVPLVAVFALVVGALVPVFALVVGALVVVFEVVPTVGVVDVLVELALELEVDWGGGVVEAVLVWLAGGGLVIVCELLRTGGVEWSVVELAVPAEPPAVNATATAPPSKTAATTNTATQNPVPPRRCFGGVAGAGIRSRFAGSGGRGASGIVASAASSGLGSVASIGTVAGVGAIAAAIAIVVSVSLPPSRSAGARPSRSRT